MLLIGGSVILIHIFIFSVTVFITAVLAVCFICLDAVADNKQWTSLIISFFIFYKYLKCYSLSLMFHLNQMWYQTLTGNTSPYKIVITINKSIYVLMRT